MKLHRRWLRRFLPPALLNRINSLSHVEDRPFDLEARRAQLAGIVLRERYANLFAPGGGAEFQVFSQDGENARECDTALPAFVLGWDGLMLEADPLSVEAAHRVSRRMLMGRPNQVEIRQAFVTRENVNALIGGGALGVLSIDVEDASSRVVARGIQRFDGASGVHHRTLPRRFFGGRSASERLLSRRFARRPGKARPGERRVLRAGAPAFDRRTMGGHPASSL